MGFDVDRRRILLDAPLRDLGLYALELRMMQDVHGQFTVAVVREGETWNHAEERQAKKAAIALAKEAQAARESQAPAPAADEAE